MRGFAPGHVSHWPARFAHPAHHAFLLPIWRMARRQDAQGLRLHDFPGNAIDIQFDAFRPAVGGPHNFGIDGGGLNDQSVRTPHDPDSQAGASQPLPARR